MLKELKTRAGFIFNVGWYHRLNGHGFEHKLGDGEGQGSLACCSPWGHKESDTTEQLNNIKVIGNKISQLLIFSYKSSNKIRTLNSNDLL